jgi:hypothetical protein
MNQRQLLASDYASLLKEHGLTPPIVPPPLTEAAVLASKSPVVKSFWDGAKQLEERYPSMAAPSVSELDGELKVISWALDETVWQNVCDGPAHYQHTRGPQPPVRWRSRKLIFVAHLNSPFQDSNHCIHITCTDSEVIVRWPSIVEKLPAVKKLAPFSLDIADLFCILWSTHVVS